LVRPFASKRHMVANLAPDFSPPCASDILDIAVAFDVLLNVLTHTLFHEALCHEDGILDRFRGGTPVANNAGAVDPRQRCTTIFGSIDTLPNIVERWTHQARPHAAPQGIAQARLEGLAVHLREPFAHLQSNIPNKAITDDDIGDATKKMLPFDIPD